MKIYNRNDVRTPMSDVAKENEHVFMRTGCRYHRNTIPSTDGCSADREILIEMEKKNFATIKITKLLTSTTGPRSPGCKRYYKKEY